MRGGCTRSHSEPGRETPQRQWYFVSRHGRVGRCQVCKTQRIIFSKRALQHHLYRVKQKRSPARHFPAFAPQLPASAASKASIAFDAGWSSPVARQAHNLKVAGSNPAPATKFQNSFSDHRAPSTTPGPFAFVAHNLKASQHAAASHGPISGSQLEILPTQPAYGQPRAGRF